MALNLVTSLNVALSGNTSLQGKVVPPKLVAKMLSVFEPNLEFYKWSEAPVSHMNSSSVIWIRPFQMTITPTQALLEEGVTPESAKIELGYVEATYKQYGIYTTITDILAKVASELALSEKAIELLSKNMARIVDRVVQDEVLDNATQRLYASTTSGGARPATRAALTSNNKLFAYDLVDARRILTNNNAPTFDDGFYRAILHPNVLFSLKTEVSIGAFLDMNTYSRPEMIEKGEFGAYSQIKLRMSSFVKTYASTVTVYPTIVFGNEAYGGTKLQEVELIVKPFGSTGTADPLNQRSTMGIKTAFAAKTLQPSAVVVIESAGQA